MQNCENKNPQGLFFTPIWTRWILGGVTESFCWRPQDSKQHLSSFHLSSGRRPERYHIKQLNTMTECQALGRPCCYGCLYADDGGLLHPTSSTSSEINTTRSRGVFGVGGSEYIASAPDPVVQTPMEINDDIMRRLNVHVTHRAVGTE